MALTHCPDCKREISSKAQSCPGCGAPGPVTFAQEFNRLAEMGSEAQKVSVPRPRDTIRPLAAKTVVESTDDGASHTTHSGPGTDKILEARIAKLESDLEYIKGDVGEIASDIKDLQKDSRTYFRLIWGGLTVVGVGLAGLMVKGFGWI